MSSLQRTDTPERLDRFDARLRAFGPYLDAYAEVAREGVASGVTSPALVVERSMAQIERILALDAEALPRPGGGARRSRRRRSGSSRRSARS